MEHGKEQSEKNQGQQEKAAGERDDGAKGTGDSLRDEGKRGRILQCLGNLNALHKVQGALLGQMQREIE